MDNKQLFRSMMDAIRSGDCEQVQSILRENGHAATEETAFGSWLHVAASRGKLEIARVLVEEFGLDVDSPLGIDGASPLTAAAAKGQYDVVQYLLDQGATMDISMSARNPLFASIQGGNVEVARLLIDRGIDTSVKYTGQRMKDMDALAFAKEWGAPDFVALLSES